MGSSIDFDRRPYNTTVLPVIDCRRVYITLSLHYIVDRLIKLFPPITTFHAVVLRYNVKEVIFKPHIMPLFFANPSIGSMFLHGPLVFISLPVTKT